MIGTAAGSNRTTWRALATGALEIAALTGAAIAQPLLDVFGRAPDVFIRAGVTRWGIALFAVVVALGPVLVIVGLEVVVAATAGERPRRLVHLAVICALGLVLALHALRSTFDWQGSSLLVIALAATAFFAVAYGRSRVVREWLRWAAPLPVVVVVLFLVFSPVADLVRGAPEPASAAVTAKSRLSVVVLLLDEFPTLSLLDANGRIDRHRTPNFARLAEESAWFRNTTAVGNYTHYAMPAVMTGRYPTEHSGITPSYAAYPDSIFRLLGGAYPVNASEVVTQLCAPSYCHPPRSANGRKTPPPPPKEGLSGVLSRARREYERMIALHDSHRIAGADTVEPVEAPATTTPLRPAARDRTASVRPTLRQGMAKLPALQPTRFTDWMARITPGGPPTLHLAHLLLPHFPWIHTSSGRTYGVPFGGGDPVGWSDGKWVTAGGADLARRRTLLQVGYVDTLLGTLVAHLKATHHWRDTVFVVTADHGGGVTLNGHTRELDDINRDEILGVPLFVHGPGMKPGIDDRPAQNIDAVPTIAGLLGVHIPWSVDGRDLSRPATARPAAHPFGLGTDFDPSYHVESIDVSAYLGDLLALARSHAVPFTSRDPDLSVLRTGPLGSMIGSPLADIATTGDAGGRRWRRDFPDDQAFANVDPEGVMPAYVVGRLEQGRPDDLVVAVVNGRIAGASDVVEPGDAPRFGLLLDPAFFVPGANDVQFFLWRDDHTLAAL